MQDKAIGLLMLIPAAKKYSPSLLLLGGGVEKYLVFLDMEEHLTHTLSQMTELLLGN